MRRRRGAPVGELRGRLCVITGAASGIGRATARAAAARGARLALADLDAAGLEATVAELGGAVVAHGAFDVADHAAVRAFAHDVHRAAGTADVVMNVAGQAFWGAVDRLDHDAWRRCVEVNLMGPIHVIEAFVPAMVAAGRGGQLVNLGSAASLFGLPWHAPYSAAKFGVRGVSEVLRFDLRRHRIGVTLVCPGAVRTALIDRVEVAGHDREEPGLRALRERFRRHAVSPERAAEAIVDGIVRNRPLVFTSRDIQVTHWLQRVAPPVYELAMRLVNDRLVRAVERR